MRMIKTNRRWLLAAILIATLTTVALFIGDAGAGVAAPARTGGPNAPEGQIFSDDLVVEAGQVYDSDVIVYSGDVRVKDGGVISADLVVYRGKIRIDEGGVVEGDLSAFSGDVKVKGRIGGDVVVWSGDIDLKETASVGGDVSVLSGDVDVDEGAQIGGEIIQGPNLKLPGAVPSFNLQPVLPDMNTPNAPADVASGAGNSPFGFLGAFWRFTGRLFGALVFTLFMGALAAGATILRPKWVARIEESAREQAALSFVTGLVTNVALVLLTLVLVITICLWPFPLIFLVLINIVGLAGTSSIAGRYLSDRLQLDLHPAIVSGLGAIVMVGVFVPFWALGGCFRFIAWLGMLLIGATGTGALIVPWLNQRNHLPAKSSAESVVDATVASSTPKDQAQPASSPRTEGDAYSDDAADNTVTVHRPETPASQTAPQPSKSGADDFTRVNGIGAVFQQRLNAAGVRTFAQLAAMTPEQIADIIGWPTKRVEKAQIIEQAKNLI